MSVNQNQLEKLIKSLEKSKSYLGKKVEFEPSYSNLIKTLNLKIDFLKKNSKPTIKLVSASAALASNLKNDSEANSQLRSLYHFEAVSPIKNIVSIAKNCSVIFLIYRSDQQVAEHHGRLINLAVQKNIGLFILVKQHKSNCSLDTIAEYFTSQEYLAISQFLLSKNCFLNFDLYQQFLIDRAPVLRNEFVQQYNQDIVGKIEQYFKTEKNIGWRKIKQVKQKCLLDRGIKDYQQQVLTKTLNNISQQQRQKILYIKQKINHSRGDNLNLFIPDSWMFEIQQIINRSQVKLVKEGSKTYLYLTVKNSDIIEHQDPKSLTYQPQPPPTEYIHSYILGKYQRQVTNTLIDQWSQINYVYGEGGLNAFVEQANEQLAAITLLEASEKESYTINLDSEPFPELDLAKIVNSACLKTNSRIEFDYNYTQSSWFKLLISVFIGTSIYLVTKLYFGTGKYIGFFILIFQIINICTGQSIRRVKLKSSQKELQRTVANRYQVLIRLIVEQLTQTLITSLDERNKRYQKNIDAIANIAQDKLNKIQQDRNQYQLRKDDLNRDLAKIKSWLN